MASTNQVITINGVRYKNAPVGQNDNAPPPPTMGPLHPGAAPAPPPSLNPNNYEGGVVPYNSQAQNPASPNYDPNYGSGATGGTTQGQQHQNGLQAFANSPLGMLWNAANSGGSNNYMQAFQNGLGAARANIQNQLSGALADIANSQRAAGAALGQYAPMVNNAYNVSTADATNAANASAAGLSRYGVGGKGNALSNADMAPERVAVNATHADNLAQQGLLSTAITQQGEHERALANLAAEQAQGNLDQSALGAYASMAGQQAQDQANQRSQLIQGVQNAGLAELQAKLSGSSNPANNTTMAGSGYGTLTSGQVYQQMNSPAYKQVVSSLQNASGSDKKAIASNLQASNPQLYWTLRGQGYIS